MKPTFSAFCVDIKADAATARLAGGRLLILGGDRPASCEIAITDQPVLAAIRLADPAFGPSIDGQAPLRPVEAAPGLQDGRPTWCRFETAQGQAMMDGDAGPGKLRGTKGPGKEQDIVLNPVQQDGEVWVEEFVYEESKGGAR